VLLRLDSPTLVEARNEMEVTSSSKRDSSLSLDVDVIPLGPGLADVSASIPRMVSCELESCGSSLPGLS